MQRLADGTQQIIDYLKKHNGFTKLTDKSDPILIQNELNMSKKNFKNSLGILYKQRLVRLEKEGTFLVQ